MPGRGPLSDVLGALDALPAPLPPGVTEVAGWALSTGAPISRVEFQIGGGPWRRADLGIAREDVAKGHEGPGAPLSGFRFFFDTDTVTPDTLAVDVRVEVVLLDGQRHPVEGATVVIDPVLLRQERAQVAPLPTAGRARTSGHPLVRRLRPRRLLAVTHSLGLAGAELQLETLIRHLRQHRWSVTVVSPTDGPGRDRVSALGADVEVLHGFGVGSEEAYEAHQDALRAAADTVRPDVIVANTLASFAGVELARRLSLPVLWDVHETMELGEFLTAGFPFEAAVAQPLRRRAAQLVASADVVVVGAHATAELLLELRGGRRIEVVPPGAQPVERGVERDAARALHGVDPDAVLLLCAGALQPRKAQGLLVHALPHVVGDGQRIQVVLAGAAEGPYAAAVRDAVHRLQLDDVVHMAGPTSQLAQLYAAADLLVSPSQNEMLPGVVMEAMEAGLPVLASRVGGVPDLIDNGRTGWLCEPNDLAALVLGVRHVLGVPAEERSAVATAARTLIRSLSYGRRRLERVSSLLAELVGR